MWYSPQMKLLQVQFSFCQLLMLRTASASASASAKTQGVIASAVLIRTWHLVMLTLWKNKSNTGRKSESGPLSLHGGQRGLGFHSNLDCLCPPTATTTDMMYWKTGHVKNIQI